jgi:hypothetical protein
MRGCLVRRNVLPDIVAEVDQQLSQAALRRGVVTEDLRECGITQRLRQRLAKSLASAGVVTQAGMLVIVGGRQCKNLPKEAANHVLKQTDRLRLHKLPDHVAEHHPNGVETLVRVADVPEPNVVQEDLLHDEDRHGFAQLRTRLHDAEA